MLLTFRYGTIAALNAAYGSAYSSFSQVPVSPTPPSPVSVAGGRWGNLTNQQVSRRWYDWQAFSQSTFRGYVHALAAAANAAVAGTTVLAPLETHLKVAANHLGGHQHSYGLDLLGLLADHGISGIDSRAGPGNVTIFPRPEPSVPGLYGGFFLSQLTYFPFAKSLAPENPLFDSETHDVSTVKYRGAMPRGYPRFFEWLSVLLGRALSMNWYWGRDKDGARPNQSYNVISFPDSTLTQPFALDEHSRALWELGSVSREIQALVSKGRRRVVVWYSRLSLVSEPAAPSSLVRAAEVATFLPLGNQIGFASERISAGKQLRTGATAADVWSCSLDPVCVAKRAAEEAAGAIRLSAFSPRANPLSGPAAEAVVVILPLAPYADDDALGALRSWLGSETSKQIVVMAENCTAGPATVEACSLFRLRANSSERALEELKWLDGPQVHYVEPGDSQSMLEAVTQVIGGTLEALREAECLVDGQPAMGVICWLAPGVAEDVPPTLFVLNMRSSAVTVSIQVSGAPLRSANSVIQEPPFGVTLDSLPNLTLGSLRVAVLRL
jgi:hypothetical protein